MPGLLSMMDELTAGTLIMPPGVALHPLQQAITWADGNVAGSGTDAPSMFPDEVALAFGVPWPTGQMVNP